MRSERKTRELHVFNRLIRPHNIVRLRRTSQIIFLVLFFFLFFQTQARFGANIVGYPVNAFHYFNPLTAISVFFPADVFKKIFLLSLITIILTLILGRFFCGWVCPLGSLNQAIAYFNKKVFKRRVPQLYQPQQKIKYLMVIFLLILFFAGINLLGFFDPFSFLSRGILPAFQRICGKFFDFLQYLNLHFGIFSHGRFFYWIQGYITYFQDFHYKYALLTSSILVIVLLLNLWVSRFWCRFICPLGAFLGFLSLPAFLNLRQEKECRNCLECARNCQGACDPHKKGEWRKQECLYCFNCLTSCAQSNLKFELGKRKDFSPVDLSKRQLLSSIVASVIAVPILKFGLRKDRLNSKLIRPPGAGNEEEFLRRCLRCSTCIKVCPTNFLHPTLLEAGLSGIWTPHGVGSLGYCKYDCNLCGQVCPAGAIKNLSLGEKQKTRIGTALVDRTRCLPYAKGVPCLICYDHCPVPGKAIVSVEIFSSRGDTLWGPSVDSAKCIGCGRCENICPVRAIQVFVHKK